MGFSEDLGEAIQSFFDSKYEIVEGTVIPDVEDVKLGPHGKLLDLAMLFIDVRESTRIVDAFRRLTAARMYKAFLRAVAAVARRNGGELRSFNGDGVLVAFIGPNKESNAVKTALNLVWVCDNCIKPKLKRYFENNSQVADIEFDFGIGVDTGKILVVRGGIRGENNNDLVWVGNATNYAVKLSSAGSDPWHTHITQDVYDAMSAECTWSDSNTKKDNMWTYTDLAGTRVLKSNYEWKP